MIHEFQIDERYVLVELIKILDEDVWKHGPTQVITRFDRRDSRLTLLNALELAVGDARNTLKKAFEEIGIKPGNGFNGIEETLYLEAAQLLGKAILHYQGILPRARFHFSWWADWSQLINEFNAEEGITYQDISAVMRSAYRSLCGEPFYTRSMTVPLQRSKVSSPVLAGLGSAAS